MHGDDYLMRDIIGMDGTMRTEKMLADITYALDQSAIVAITDRTGKIVYVNKLFVEISGYSTAELLGSTHAIVNSGHHPQSFFKEMWKTIGKGITWRGEICNKRKDGSYYWVDTTIVPFLNDKKMPYQYVSIRHDVSERKKSEEMVRNLAYNDQLTQLPNRTSIRRVLQEELLFAKKAGVKLALVYVNIDRLRYVNDAFGHEAGDYILSVIAKRMKDSLRHSHLLGRTSGDEFIFLLKEIRNPQHVQELMTEIKSYLEKPMSIKGKSTMITFSFGISLFPEHATELPELAMKAEKALGIVRAHGGVGYEIYEPGTASKTLERIVLENELRKSVKGGHFHLDYQPKVNLKTKKLIGVEALVRWDHPDLGRIAPDKFIPLAEETKLVLPLGEWVLRKACEQTRKWQDKGFVAFRTAVNMSVIQLEEPTIFETITTIIEETGVSPEFLEIELTESAFADLQGMQSKIQQIRALGITISIDDFGTGYSNFSYIRELPADTLKIDISFVRNIHRNESDRSIVTAIATLAISAGLTVIAEGIENEEQIEILSTCGCEQGQGFFFSKPVSGEESEQFMIRSMNE